MKTRTLFLLLLAESLAVAPLQATMLVRLSLEQLTQASTEIVRAHVVQQESHWNADHTQILTFTTVAVDDSMKGHPGSTMVIEQLGGRVGNIHVQVPGTVTFHPQQTYMLFLEPAGPDSPRSAVVGMVQGSFHVVRDATTNEERVVLPLRTLTSAASGGVQAPAGTVSLKEFRQQLSTAAATPMVIPRGTSIPVVVRSTESQGMGRVHVQGTTTSDLFPSQGVVIPAGSPVEGDASMVSGKWRIRWTEISVRGARAQISGESQEPAGALRDRQLLIDVR